MYDFANDPLCAPVRIREQKAIIKNFCNWIHLVAKFNIEKNSTVKMLTGGDSEHGLNDPYLLQIIN
jgi:hypothetical protein